MILFEIAIPVKPNDAFNEKGNLIDGVTWNMTEWKFAEAWHQFFFAHVVSIAGGYTRFAPAEGFWKSDDGVIFNEQMIPVRIALDVKRNTTADEMIKLIAEFAKEHYSQLAIFVAKIGTAEII